MNKLIGSEEYDPNNLVDHLIDKMQLKNDAALCRSLAISPPMLSKIRKKHLAINGDFLVRVYDVTGIDVDELRELASIPRTVIEPPKPFKRSLPQPETVGA